MFRDREMHILYTEKSQNRPLDGRRSQSEAIGWSRQTIALNQLINRRERHLVESGRVPDYWNKRGRGERGDGRGGEGRKSRQVMFSDVFTLFPRRVRILNVNETQLGRPKVRFLWQQNAEIAVEVNKSGCVSVQSVELQGELEGRR